MQTPQQKQRYRLDLTQLQSLCGENYLRLLRLQRACDEENGLAMTLAKDTRVHLRVTSESRYTTGMMLTQQGQHPLLGKVQLDVRLYHDVQLAEVIAMHPCQHTAARNPYPNAVMHQPDEKHQWNRFLGDWLRHLEQHGQPTVQHWRQLVSRSAS
jgi:uncharacterized protein YqiB (DUF1249 family)